MLYTAFTTRWIMRTSLKPRPLAVFLIFLTILRDQLLFFQTAPPQNAGNRKNPGDQTHPRAAAHDPAQYPQDEAGIHGMAQVLEQAAGHQVVNVFHAAQKVQGGQGQSRAGNEHQRTDVADGDRQVNMPGVQRTHEHPRGQEQAHPQDDHSQYQFVLRVDLPGFLEDFVAVADQQTGHAEDKQGDIRRVHKSNFLPAMRLMPDGQNGAGDAQPDKLVAHADQPQVEGDLLPDQLAAFQGDDEPNQGQQADQRAGGRGGGAGQVDDHRQHEGHQQVADHPGGDPAHGRVKGLAGQFDPGIAEELRLEPDQSQHQVDDG